MPLLGSAEFGVRTFYAASYPNDKCGANGLPLTPNSAKILGKFQFLTTLTHPNICQYIDINKTKYECMFIISEHYGSSLRNKLQGENYMSESEIVAIAYQILEGLHYLHTNGVVHRNICLENILLTKQGQVKLSEYGLYHMTGSGAHVSFPIGLPEYLSPETVCSGPVQVADDTIEATQPSSGPKTDIWSFAIVVLELAMKRKLWGKMTTALVLKRIIEMVKSDLSPLEFLAQDPVVSEQLKRLSKDFFDMLQQCLTVQSSKRVDTETLRKHPVFQEQRIHSAQVKTESVLFTSNMHDKNLELPVYEDTIANEFSDDHLSQRSMQEVFYLWRLAGGDIDGALRKAGMTKTRPPIHLLPCFGIVEGELFGQDRDYAELLDNTVITLSQEQLRHRLRDISPSGYYPLLEDESTADSKHLPPSASHEDLSDSASLPLVIREKDIEYQFHRIILFERLLKAYPFKRPQIWKEARLDIPPLVRAYVWAAILEVEGDIQERYDAIDKETPTTTDRQIEVDVPRCHQYHELLSSPSAHAKFKRVLKAWVISNPQYVYWQGLDSLCAPFLALAFNNEALAFSCLSAFIPKYLHKFFLKDNSPVIQEYLAVFSHLIAFHDPELSNHLDGIGFIPDLYAIPWFLTMYAHVFPLHKIVHLWDTLLLGNSSFPLCIGVSILQQLRDRLLSFGFNECILLFSDMPEIDMEKCVRDSIKVFCSTPKSATYRQHARPVHKTPKVDDRPTLSYYSKDYHEQPSNELSMEQLPLEELKGDKCPRISAEDLIELAELAGAAQSRSPTKKRQNSKPLILMIDVRSADDHRRGTLQGAINIPFQMAFSPEGDLNPSPAVTTLNSTRSQVIVVIGNRGKIASNFANELVRLNYPKVCVLHKGIDVFRSTGLITLPPVDI